MRRASIVEAAVMGLILCSPTPAAWRVTAVAAGGRHSLALASDGTVWAWGSNDRGQLGDGTHIDRSTPVRVLGLTGVAGIAAGGSHSLASKADGTVWAWGWGESGQLGDGTATDRWAPVQVSGLTGVVAIAAGGIHSLAVKGDGSVWAWGGNRSGALGDGTTISDQPAPVQVSGLTGVVEVAAGAVHSIALKSDGTLWAWGQNESGQLGNGTATQEFAPVQVSGINGIVAIAAGGGHSLALQRDGAVWAWGANHRGQLGDGTYTNRLTPVQARGIDGVVAVTGAGGSGRTLAVKSNGTVWVWGVDEVGDGPGRTAPAQVPGIDGALAVAGGNSHSLVLKSDGSLWAWGANTSSQLGDGAFVMRTAPHQVAWITGAVAVAGRPGAWALKEDGTVWLWGEWWPPYGNRPVPTPIPGLSGVTAIAGGGLSLALTADRTVWQWGSPVWQLIPPTQTPALVSGLSDVTAISAGSGDLYWDLFPFPGFSLALKDDGTVWEWYNGDQRPPSQVGLGGVVGIAAGFSHALAVKDDGTVWQWTSQWRQEGPVPDRVIQVEGLSSIKAIASAFENNVALSDDGTVWEWQLPASTPVPVDGLTGMVAVAPADNGLPLYYGGFRLGYTLALKRDGTVWAWGDNSSGQLGDGTTFRRRAPVQAGGLAGVVAIATGDRLSLAVKSDGTVWAWGSNNSGQLGDERVSVRTMPAQVIPPGSPDLTIEMSHDGDFTVGAPGRYMLTVTNAGAMATSGTITITDVLPPGVTYVSAAGSEWNCTAAERIVACANPRTLNGGDSSTVWLYVDVGPAATPGATNLATVSNASDRNISNNTIGDPTVVSWR